jgi:hypothetical protein
MLGDQNDIEAKKEDIRNDLRACGYQIWVMNTYTGRNWDNSESKHFILAYPAYSKYSERWEIYEMNPCYLKTLGFDWFFKKSVAYAGCFYDGVLGMSRAFNIVYSLSSWLFRNTPDAENAHNKDAGYVLTQR